MRFEPDISFDLSMFHKVEIKPEKSFDKSFYVIKEWCNQYIKCRYWDSAMCTSEQLDSYLLTLNGYMIFYFEDKDEAIKFKLIWG